MDSAASLASAAFALEILRELHQPAVQIFGARLGARFLAIELGAGEIQPLQRRAADRLGFAQGSQCLGGSKLLARRLGLHARMLGDRALRGLDRALGLGDRGLGVAPAQRDQHALVAADLARDLLVADGLAGLALEPVDLAGDLADHVLQAREIGVGALEPRLGLVPAGVQPGDAGRFFEDAAARTRAWR